VQVQGVIVFLALVIALCTYAFFFLPAPTPKAKPVPIQPPRAIDYSASCLQLHEKVRELFFSLGVKDRDFTVLSQHPLYERGKKWRFVEVLVSLPRRVGLPGATAELLKTLEGFEVTVTPKPRGQEISVRVQGKPTYLVLMTAKPPALAIIIDDIGESLELTRAFLDVGVPLTLSILPNLPHSQDSERLVHERGFEAMLHLPMEPKDRSGHDPGEGAIRLTMEQDQVHAAVHDALAGFHYLKGVNNHMGSCVTEEARITGLILGTLKPTGLYFIDSRTSPRSRAYSVAQELGIPSAANELFIDNDRRVDSCKKMIEKALAKAKAHGQCIVIGHPRESTCRALKEMVSRIKEEGVALVFASELTS
jgi:polysaccharide deacetylase 2 family uncharacterized protein YibQ